MVNLINLINLVNLKQSDKHSNKLMMSAMTLEAECDDVPASAFWRIQGEDDPSQGRVADHSVTRRARATLITHSQTLNSPHTLSGFMTCMATSLALH